MKKIALISLLIFNALQSASHTLGSWDQEHKKLKNSFKKRKKVLFVRSQEVSTCYIKSLIEDLLFAQEYYKIHGKYPSIQKVNRIRILRNQDR